MTHRRGLYILWNVLEEELWCLSLEDYLKPSADLSVSSLPQQPLTVWWDLGVPGHHAHLHVELAAQRGVAKCPYPPETEARPVLTSSSVEDALETTPYAALQKVDGFVRVPTCVHLCVLRVCSVSYLFGVSEFSGVLLVNIFTVRNTSVLKPYLQLLCVKSLFFTLYIWITFQVIKHQNTDKHFSKKNISKVIW